MVNADLQSKFDAWACAPATELNHPWATQLRDKSKALVAQTPVPTARSEAFRHLPLDALYRVKWNAFPDSVNSPNIDELATTCEHTKDDRLTLTFINGRPCLELSSDIDTLAAHGVCLFSQASPSAQDTIQEHLGTLLARSDATLHPFAQLNNAQLHDGVLVHVEAKQHLDKPLYLHYVEHGLSTDETALPAWCPTRVLVVLDNSAKATVVERHISTGKQPAQLLVNAIGEFYVGDNAELTHYRIQTADDSSRHIGGTHGCLMRDARYRAVHIGFGSALTRNDIVMHMQGRGADSDIAGFYVPRGRHVIDFHTDIEHLVPNCTSQEVFRGLTDEQATAIFNGRIHIHPDAQKTLAELNNKNLLLSDSAQVYTKPELEIYADDVRCAHGATIAKIDDQAVFYLQSRGINKAAAKVLLSFGFVNEILDCIEIDALADELRDVLSSRLLSQ